MDVATFLGIGFAILAVVGGHVFEGGHVSDIMQGTAAVIVFGGTFGAIACQYSMPILIQAGKDVMLCFKFKQPNLRLMIRQIVDMSSKARREGVLAIEKELDNLDDPFMQKALGMVADGMKVNDIKPTLELEIDTWEEHAEKSADVWETAGGYCPTIGIIGAVLGLIHVMQNLTDPGSLGAGISVAFVATVYGVGAANLLMLPLAGKIKSRVRDRVVAMELIVEGTCAISAGESPLITERRLAIYAQHRKSGADPADAEKAAAEQTAPEAKAGASA